MNAKIVIIPLKKQKNLFFNVVVFFLVHFEHINYSIRVSTAVNYTLNVIRSKGYGMNLGAIYNFLNKAGLECVMMIFYGKNQIGAFVTFVKLLNFFRCLCVNFFHGNYFPFLEDFPFSSSEDCTLLFIASDIWRIFSDEVEMLSVATVKFSTPAEICLSAIRICSEALVCC